MIVEQTNKEPTEVVAAQKKGFTYQRSFKLLRGHKVFMFLNGVVSEFNDFSSAEIDFQTGEIRRRIVKKNDSFFVSALNIRNAIKKFKKMGLDVSKYSEHTGPKSKQTNNPRLERDKPKN